MNRRGFLGTILTLAAAPAIVRASSLMPVRALQGPITHEMLQGMADTLTRHNVPLEGGRFFISLHTGAPDSYDGLREVSYANYARQTVTREQLLGYVTFPQCTGGHATITHVGVEDAQGNRRMVPINYPQMVGPATTLHVAGLGERSNMVLERE